MPPTSPAHFRKLINVGCFSFSKTHGASVWYKVARVQRLFQCSYEKMAEVLQEYGFIENIWTVNGKVRVEWLEDGARLHQTLEGYMQQFSQEEYIQLLGQFEADKVENTLYETQNA